MTDKEIIKALECLSGKETLCLHCAYDPCEFPRCKENVAQDALHLIKRLKKQLDAKCDRCIARDRAAGISDFVAAAKDRIVSDFLNATGGENTAQSVAVLKVLDILDEIKNEMTEDES